MADNGRDRTDAAPHVVVVGGGIAGLAAAFFLKDEPVRVTVLEGASRLGGKLAVSEVAGVAVDEGAEALYARRPKTTGLIKAAGLGDRIAMAGTKAAAVWTGNGIRPLPGRQLMGVPADMDDLAATGILSGDGVARAREDATMPPSERDGDVSVAAYVAGRLGQEVVDRLVDPFLCDVYAGRAEELSFEATLTPLAVASRKYPSLAAAAASVTPPPDPAEEKVPPGIATLAGGLGTLPGVLAEAVLAASPGAAVRTGATVRELARAEHGWRLTVGTGANPEYITADAVVVAVPAGPAGTLLAGVPGVAQAAAGLAEIPYADTAVITLAYPREAFSGGPAGRRLSGYRVPPVEGRTVSAVTFTTVKWPHLAGEVEIVRCQAGRIGDEKLLQRDDAELAALAASEFAEATGVTGAPVATRVTRWDGSLPQYTVGHLDRVARIRASVATQPGLAVCGAAYDGVGVGTSIATARKAADQVLTWLREKATARSVR
ncbi:protoporphyrinogen oxidase [Actinoallomurus spadix]|uniref:Coproporphyrinogen III oxidase n=1 Tax=Actinoallomurus spadix TaxID=79912 RepID=A0ABP3H1S7_9ACTN|nr:protoporphyrinogen oxidase [Actinoallomurus spadix]MCO5984506.1 protoporphyrinogen oxidase [Actinoallomurus spadix]